VIASWTPEQRAALERLLAKLAGRVDGAIDSWTLVCLMPEGSMDRRGFLLENGRDVQDLAGQLEAEVASSGRGGEEEERRRLAALRGACRDLSDAFLALERFRTAPLPEVRSATGRVQDVCRALYRELGELAAVLGVGAVWEQGRTPERQAYYQKILDHLFETFCQTLAADRQAAGVPQSSAP
jgi:hypothetical protein